jgi:hypothetical protein
MNNKIVAIGLICLVILLVASIVFFDVILPKPIVVSPKVSLPSPTPTPAAVNSTIQVSGMLSHWDLQFQFTDIEFTNNNLTYDAPIQNGSYSISLPNQQDYDILGTWGGRTIDVGPAGGTGAIELDTLNLNVGAGVTSITHDLPALNPNPTPPPITQSTPTLTPSIPEFPAQLLIITLVGFMIVVLSVVIIANKRFLFMKAAQAPKSDVCKE